MPDLILDLAEIPADALALVGGKGLNLGRLVRAGLPVPTGFVITTEAYRLRDRAPEAVRTAVRSAYARLGGRAVAVRSSSTVEDLEALSFAGQHETHLGVVGEAALLEAVRRCWASLFTERSAAYRRAQGIPDDRVAMAVVVQLLIDADVAGVLFTRDPSDLAAPAGAGEEGSGSILVEASWGLGEAVVSGRVTPDRWTLAHGTGDVLSARIAAKPIVSTARGEQPVPPELQSVPCLTPEALRRLAEWGRRVEAEYGVPQDIEWALQGDACFLLQSRAITASADEREAVRREEIAHLRLRADPGGTVWSRYSLAEVLPEPLPLTWAYWREFMSGGGGYGKMYRELGYDPDPALDRDGVLDLIAGRPYFNLTRDSRLYFHRFPYDYPFDKLKANPALALYPTPEANLARAPKEFLLRLPGITRRMLMAEKTLERAAGEVPQLLETGVFPRMARYAAEQRSTDRSCFNAAELLQAIEACRALLFDEFLPQGLKASVLGGLAIQKLRLELTPRLGQEGARQSVDRLLAGAAPPPEFDLTTALRNLAEGRLSEAEFRRRFGHRGAGEMELANPRWRETGLPGAAVPASPAEAEPEGVGRETLPEVQTLLAATRAARLLERARRFTALRETSKHFFMLGYEVLRELLLEVGRRTGLGSGVFYLEPGELGPAVGGEDVGPLIAARRKRRALAIGLEVPRVVFSDDLEAIGRTLAPPAAGEAFSGTGVSSGVAEGLALVLRSPDLAPAEAQGFILVCPSTDPGWVPLFLRARGVVLETGGVLSHGAIVARELGLPAVANIDAACSVLRTGRRVRIDGALGTVWSIDERPLHPGEQPAPAD